MNTTTTIEISEAGAGLSEQDRLLQRAGELPTIAEVQREVAVGLAVEWLVESGDAAGEADPWYLLGAGRAVVARLLAELGHPEPKAALEAELFEREAGR